MVLFITEIDVLLKVYSTVYFDMSILTRCSAETHEAELKRLINAGFGDRIMFGSDTRPAAICAASKISRAHGQAAPSDPVRQRRCFLRLDEHTIARHHARVAAPDGIDGRLAVDSKSMSKMRADNLGRVRLSDQE